MYAILALGALAAVWGVVHWLEAKGYEKGVAEWKPKYETLHKQFDDFTDAVAKRGKEREAESDARDKAWKEAYDDTKQKLSTRTADLAATLKRLRDRPPASPSGGEVSVTACPAVAVQGGPGEPVPSVTLADYRALEARCVDDADMRYRMRATFENCVKVGACVWDTAK